MTVNYADKKLKTWGWLLHSLGAALTGVAFAIFFTLVIWPIGKRQTEIMQKTVHLKQILDVEGDVREEHRRLTQALFLADDKIDKLFDRIPNVPREGDFLGQITTLASNIGLEIVDYRPGSTNDQGEYQEMTVTISSEGSYTGMCSFLQRLDGLPRLSRITELKMTPHRNSESYTMNITLAIFFAPKSKLARTQLENGRE